MVHTAQVGELLRGVREEDLVHRQVTLRQDRQEDPVQPEQQELRQGMHCKKKKIISYIRTA